MECKRLKQDIVRLGKWEPSMKLWEVSVGVLVDDDEVVQYYETIVGTLKAARKRGIVHFEGEVLLRGSQDMTLITLLQPPRPGMDARA
jgi:hypothetical protein